MPRISTIISIYKEPIDWIERSLRSVVDQTNQNLFFNELIVVLDNPQYEKEVDVLINKIESNIVDTNFRLIYVKNKQNIGLASSLNKAFHVSTGDYIARLDSDDINLPDRYMKQFEFMKNNASVSLCGSSIYRIDENETVAGLSSNPSDFKKLKKQVLCKSIAYHPTWFVKREVYEALEGYRDIPAAQDLDFILRAMLYNYTISNHPDPLVYYRINNNSISVKKSLLQRKCQRFITTNYKKGTLACQDSLSGLQEFIKYDDKENFKHQRSQKLFLKAMRSKKNPIMFLTYLTRSIFLSREQFLYLYCHLKYVVKSKF